jgi:multidrug resistance efflux pump
LPTVVLDDGAAAAQRTPGSQGSSSTNGGGVVASGVVAPAQEARLVFNISGQVESVEAAVGDQVAAGQVLVRLKGKEDLRAAISAAQFELAQAQKALADLEQNASESRVQALERIANATKAVRDAAYQLDNFTVPASLAGMDTRAALEQTQAALNTARLAFEPYRYYPSTNDTREDLKEKLDQAQADYNSAVRRLQVETELEVAQADLETALADFEIWKEGPDPADRVVAEARLANAQAALDAAQAQLESLEVKAPFGGTVAAVEIHPGEWVLAGEPVLALADLEHLQIETTDLSERDVPRVAVGQPAVVFIEALSQEVEGQVVGISPLAETLGGDVVYMATISMVELPPGLRAGMSVEVQFIGD